VGWTKVNKRLAEKCREPYAFVMIYIRTKLRIALLRSTFAAIQGFLRQKEQFLGPESDGH